MGYKGDKRGFFPDMKKSWADDWRGMPEFIQEDKRPWRSIKVRFSHEQRDGALRELAIYFERKEDIETFSALVGQRVTPITRYISLRDSVELSRLIGQSITDLMISIWHPKKEVFISADKAYVTDKPICPRYPIYVISKGRWESRMTSKALEKMGVYYHIVIEPQEYKQYAAVIAPEKVLTLPFSNLGQGSIPARNWVWEHSIAAGAKKHWIFDDNIEGFYRLNRNMRIRVLSGSIFSAAEDFTDRYENVAISGFQYKAFAPAWIPRWRPFTVNTRIYSCILLRNDIPYRWRGRYNEDTDLSLRALKDGWCTILFWALLANKMPTMTMRGGNTEELYEIENGRLKMAQSLIEQHPDVTKLFKKWGRWQHLVNYKPFANNKLVLRKGVKIPSEINNYGMFVKKLDPPAGKKK